MGTKWLKGAIVESVIAILLVVGLIVGLSFAWYYITNAGFAIFMGVLLTVALFFRMRDSHGMFQVMKFDEKGFYFYDVTGLRCSCTWESIEKLEWYRTKNALNDYNERYRPVYLTVYNNEHFLELEMNENGRIYNRDIRGRRFKVNKSDSELVLVIGLITGSVKTFKKYVEHYRPDLFIGRHTSMIYDDMQR